MPIKVLHISAAGENSGAGKAALNTHFELLNLGIDSKILFQKSDIKAIGVYSYHRLNLYFSAKRLIFTLVDGLIIKIYSNRDSQLFSAGFIGVSLYKLKLFKWADIIHVHWANQGFLNIKEIEFWNKPLIWTLRDMWAFTGGCHQSFECNKFNSECGSCPILKSTFKNDLSTIIQKRKLIYFKSNLISWVAISTWMQKVASKSSVLKNKYIHIIPSGVDSKKFLILDKNNLKDKYNLQSTSKIILIGAGNLRESYKGFDFTINLMNKVDKNLIVITFGSTSFKSGEIPQQVFHFGYINEYTLLELYNLSDLFFSPSVAEAMGKTFLEAQFCGLPVLCFKETGPEDIVMHKITGYTAQLKDENDLLNGFYFCLKYSWDKKFIRETVINKFDIKIVAQNYISLYKKELSRL